MGASSCANAFRTAGLWLSGPISPHVDGPFTCGEIGPQVRGSRHAPTERRLHDLPCISLLRSTGILYGIDCWL